ncbi:copper amine oxidase N-terminal domain-containing protein [Desulfofundulus sp. TPOSR]|uniref:copper amine oxidase N-terminal domain-containing protein n=1 Tax=Desulfofundulus sp. TPOSR TaxID=2714340 RepID=UPI0014088985|nr:copper amine oxidase N-terminal domain-containing protein [Desulfofundulus sp. TPOSR]NHM26967.1 copper amine oxidase N-terminal domain-containing protein [Desulfofundulus sp. TPOSR]
MKIKRMWRKGLLILTVTVLALTLFATVGWTGDEDVEYMRWNGPPVDSLTPIKYRMGSKIVIMEFPDIEKYAWRLGAGMGERYPAEEVLEVNGVPWQDSPYAEVIKENLTFYGESGSYFARHPELMEIVLDKRFNGKGAEVWKLFSQGKSVAEIKQILLGGSEKKQPGTGSSNEKPSPEELPPPEPGEVSVVLYLNQKDYSVAREGTWHRASLDAAPVYQNGRTLVPLRGVMEQFGADVKWLPESKQIKVQLGDREVVLTLGSTEAQVNGRAAKLDVPAKVVNGRTLIPLRFVSEQIGMDVVWEAKTQSITIKQKQK